MVGEWRRALVSCHGKSRLPVRECRFCTCFESFSMTKHKAHLNYRYCYNAFPPMAHSVASIQLGGISALLSRSAVSTGSNGQVLSQQYNLAILQGECSVSPELLLTAAPWC